MKFNFHSILVESCLMRIFLSRCSVMVITVVIGKGNPSMTCTDLEMTRVGLGMVGEREGCTQT